MEPQSPTNVPSEQIQLSVEFSASLKQWLKIFGEHYQQAITEANAAAYVIGLRDVDADDLNAACEQALKECEFIPKIADIRKRIPLRFALARITTQMIALDMYEKTMRWLRMNDGIENTAKEELPPVAEYAVKVAGGRECMLSGEPSDAEWARKHFVETYEEIYIRLREQGITTREGAREALGIWKQGQVDLQSSHPPTKNEVPELHYRGATATALGGAIAIAPEPIGIHQGATIQPASRPTIDLALAAIRESQRTGESADEIMKRLRQV